MRAATAAAEPPDKGGRQNRPRGRLEGNGGTRVPKKPRQVSAQRGRGEPHKDPVEGGPKPDGRQERADQRSGSAVLEDGLNKVRGKVAEDKRAGVDHRSALEWGQHPSQVPERDGDKPPGDADQDPLG